MARFKISVSVMVSCVALLAAAPLIAGDVPRDRESLDQQVMWTTTSDPEATEATFIPNGVLRSERFDQLPFNSSSRWRLPTLLSRAKELKSPPCTVSSETTATGDPWPEAMTLVEAIRAPGTVAMVGEVVAWLEGWSNLHVAPGTLVHVAVQEVLAPPPDSGSPSLSTEPEPEPVTFAAAFHLEGGRAEIDGLVLCSLGPDLKPVAEGERLLVVGVPLPSDPSQLSVQLWGAHYFSVEDDTVLPQTYSHLRDRDPQSLETLRKALSGGEADK